MPLHIGNKIVVFKYYTYWLIKQHIMSIILFYLQHRENVFNAMINNAIYIFFFLVFTEWLKLI